MWHLHCAPELTDPARSTAGASSDMGGYGLGVVEV